MSFLSDANYSQFLDERIRAFGDAATGEYVRRKFDAWRRQYFHHRLIERAAELLASERDQPSMLYLRNETDIELLGMLAQWHRFDASLFRGFLVEESLWDSLKPEWFSPFPVCRVRDWQDRENTVVLTLSDSRPLRENGTDRGNDFLDCFIDESRLSVSDEVRQKLADRRVVLYVDYRKVQTLVALSEEIRKNSDFATVLLVNSAQGFCGQEFDAVIEQPFFYLWPLVFRSLAPDLFHVNVGWGTQGLPFAPFLPQDAVIDFYDLLTFVRDDALDGHHSEPLALTRSSEKTLFSRFNRFIHRCSDAVTKSLDTTYPGKDIVSVTEYLREPLYVSEPARQDGIIGLVYGGLLVQEGAGPEDPHYKNFLQMVKYYCRGNLHLYLYPSPYLYGFGAPRGVEELVQRMGLKNVHPCLPLAENDFVREITRYDFGMCLPTPEDVRPTSYGYILPSKFITYLRAGLPIVVPEDQTFIADLVRDHGIGVVYGYDDHERMAEILNGQDIDRLKENVVRFREEFRIERAVEKVLRLYDGAANSGGLSLQAVRSAVHRRKRVAGTPPAKATASQPPAAATVHSWPGLLEKLDRLGFISASEYESVLDQEVGKVLSGPARQYVAGKLQSWLGTYRNWRRCDRLFELVVDLKGRPYSLYLDNPADLDLLAYFLHGLDENGVARPAGFIVADGLEGLKSRLAPASVSHVRDGVPEGHVVIGFSGARFPGKAGDIRTNDYLDRFIDSRRFREVRDTQRSLAGGQIALYPLYREIHTVPMIAQFVRKKDERIRCLALSPSPLIHEDFDASLVEPFLCLWPLIFRILDPALVHLNVGWGIQALSLSPFLPDRERTVIDFYEVLSFLPDAYFDKTHSTAEQVRFAEEHFCGNYDHIIHLCSDKISARLAEKYDHHGSIVSVTEYLQEPAYSKPPRNDGVLRLVYGGCMLATTNADDLYYRAFTKVVPHFTRGNLQLYVYNSPYVHGLVENGGLKEVIRRLGLTNIHACTPKKLDEFVREISDYDLGVTLLRPKDMNAVEYNYFMATKFLTYLQAGLPVVIDADNHFMAGLVERYNIGVVLRDHDLEHLPEILNSMDLPALKRNVVKFREEFSIEKGGAKVLKMYREILEKAESHCVLPASGVQAPELHSSNLALHTSNDPAFEQMIETMARRENRLYYRDQSARTMSSLAALARQFGPSVIVELGTLGGLSLRTWIASTKQTRIYAVDLSFQTLHETLDFLPADLSRVTLLERDILQTDFTRLWTAGDKVIFFVDAHDLANVPIMAHVLTTAVAALPEGSIVVVDDLWFSEKRLTRATARDFLENHVVGEIDELQCFHGHYAPYHQGGSFMGFAEVIPLLRFVNEHGIPLVHDQGAKHTFFMWKKAHLSNHGESAGGSSGSEDEYGSVQYNPLESVPASGSQRETMRQVAALYQRKDIRGAAESLSQTLARDPRDQALSYGLAVCLARGGMLAEARDVLSPNLSDSGHPRYRRLFDDLVQRVGPAQRPSSGGPQQSARTCGLTIFAMPKAFSGHTGLIQKNAIRSWARLDPKPEILLFGAESGIREMAQEVGARHIPEVDRNEFGTPLVNKLFQAAEKQASHEVLAYVNADMILMGDFPEAVQKVQASLPNFLLIGQRWDLPVLEELDFDNRRWKELLQRQLQKHAMLHAECGLDYFVFRKGLWPEIPPFAIGRTAWDNWLVMNPNKRGVPVVDGTEFITAVHQDHDYAHVAGGRQEAWNGAEAARNRELAGTADHFGLTSGATWLLCRDGTLAETRPRQPQYITVAYRGQRSAWLLRQAGELIAAGATELAACKCEETLACLDGWMELRRLGCMSTEPADCADIGVRYVAGHTLLAQCYMKIGRYEQVVATYNRLLVNRTVRISAAQRDSIVQVRDQLIRQMEKQEKQQADPSVSQGCPDAGASMGGSPAAKSSVAGRSIPAVERGGAADRRPKVTLITSCRDAEPYLRDCIESVLNQTMPDWELFLIDDGSTDNTRRLIEEYARQDARIRPHYFPDSRGPYARRNFAISQAASDFIVIQDADDIMSPEKLERLYDAINRDSRLAIVGSHHRKFLEEFRGLEYTEPADLPVDHDTIADSCLTWHAAISHGTAMIRKALFSTIGVYDENPFAADAFWSAKLALYARVGAPVRMANIPEYLTLIRTHPSSQTQVLPVFDPRSRRTRYRHYCECRLRRIQEKWGQRPQVDLATELRACNCSDFLTRFKAKIIQWESEALPVHFVNELLTNGLSFFRQKAYVSSVIVLSGVEVMQRDIARRVAGFNLVRGMAYCASGLPERGLSYLRREIENHENLAAHKFLRDSQERGPSMDAQSWCARHAPDLELRLGGQEREQVRVALT